MAKIRDLKNEVNYLTFEIIADCNTYMGLHPENKEKTMKLVDEAVILRNSLIQKINHPEKNSTLYFKEVKKELVDSADKIFEKLRKLIK